MKIKNKIALYLSLLFTLLFGIVAYILIVQFSKFRQEEFQDRLDEKITNTIKYFRVSKEDFFQTPKRFVKLPNEQISLFNSNCREIYIHPLESKTRISHSKYIPEVKKKKRLYANLNTIEILGKSFTVKNQQYYIIISANDVYGFRKLQFLKQTLLLSYLLFTFVTIFFIYFIVQKQLYPLNKLHKKISKINEENLHEPIDVEVGSLNEINLLSEEFNRMLERISTSYDKQREFTSQASHELRTPLARLTMQLENQLLQKNKPSDELIQTMLLDLHQLNELIHSLLLLSKIDAKSFHRNTDKLRIDEVLYSSIEKTTRLFPDLKVNFFFNSESDFDSILEINCAYNLLEIVFSNLLKNAYKYSNDQSVMIEISRYKDKAKVIFSNEGVTLNKEEEEKIFKEAFVRGEHTKSIAGHGLGLRIVYRILSTFDFKVQYKSHGDQTIIEIVF